MIKQLFIQSDLFTTATQIAMVGFRIVDQLRQSPDGPQTFQEQAVAKSLVKCY